MLVELDGLGFFGGMFEEDLLEENLKSLPKNISEAIFSRDHTERKLIKPVNKILSSSAIHQKVFCCFKQTPTMQVNGGMTVGGTATWGGKEGTQYSGYAQGQVQDNRGNRAEMKVEQKSDGTGRLNVSATHEMQKTPSSKEKK